MQRQVPRYRHVDVHVVETVNEVPAISWQHEDEFERSGDP
jgi:hypothetical protein